MRITKHCEARDLGIQRMGEMSLPSCRVAVAPRSAPSPRLGRRARSRPPPRAARGDDDGPSTSSSSSRSSWDGAEKGGRAGEDYLYALGDRSASVSTEVGARKGMVDDVFAGTAHAKFNLGADADIASGELRYRPELRRLRNVTVDGNHVPPRFLDRVALHIAKNAMVDKNGPWSSDAVNGRPPLTGEVPLLLGVWGPKGSGKSYNLELCLRALNATSVIMSAGELEDPLAGVPGRTIRERYRSASRAAGNSGVLSCLVINDVDAGAGAFRHTQNTVNSQMVVGTLMNICDHPDRVCVGSETYRADEKPLRRVPIVVTGNDLSTLYAPLLRDGRMDKFLWAPNAEELVDVVASVFSDFPGFKRDDAEKLTRAFPKQRSLDFFGAMHARTVDDAVLRWVKETTMTNGNENTRERVSLASALFGGGSDSEEITPDWNRVRDASVFSRATRSSGVLPALIEIGNDLAAEQERVMQTRLVEEYMPGVRLFGDKKSARASEEKKLAEKRARALLERERAAAAAAHAASESTRAAAESARAALAKASRENPREALRLESPAERAARANKRRAEATASEVANGDASRTNAGGWTILDGGVSSEASVTEKPEYDAFDTMDWG